MIRQGHKQKIQDARDTPYDDSVTNLTADDVNTAIEKLNATGGISASPGFTWGKSGNVNSGAYLDNDTVPSNLAGRLVPLSNGEIKEVFVANENANTFTVAVEKNVGGVFTLLCSIAVVAARTKTQSFTGVTVALGDELAVKVSAGSCKNPVVGVVIKGTTV